MNTSNSSVKFKLSLGSISSSTMWPSKGICRCLNQLHGIFATNLVEIEDVLSSIQVFIDSYAKYIRKCVIFELGVMEYMIFYSFLLYFFFCNDFRARASLCCWELDEVFRFIYLLSRWKYNSIVYIVIPSRFKIKQARSFRHLLQTFWFSQIFDMIGYFISLLIANCTKEILFGV